MENFVNVNTNIEMRFKTKKCGPSESTWIEDEKKKYFCLLFPFDISEWNGDSAIHFFIIFFDSNSDYVILLMLQLRHVAKNVEMREFSGENNPIHYPLYCELENATRNLQLHRTSRFAFRILLLAIHFFQILRFSHHFNQKIYCDKMTQTQRWRHMQFSPA